MRETISHYRILERIGAGGMGEVYRAEDLLLKRVVALKFLSRNLIGSRQSRQQLIAEAQAAASINHPRVATIYEIGQVDGLVYIAMEHIEGRSLGAMIAEQPLPLGQALQIAIETADALKAAHQRGLVHCDIKSSNIIITLKGHAKLLDFGLAKLASGDGRNLNHPAQAIQPAASRPSGSANAITGTLAYMSPEQVRGEAIGKQSDIFSLGVVLFEMLAGRRPFDGESRAAIIQAILDQEPPRLGLLCGDAPLEIESIVRKALEKNLVERYQTIDEMLAELESLKHRLEIESAQDGSARPLSNESDRPATVSVEEGFAQIASICWRYRKWFLAFGIAPAIAAILDIFAASQHRLGPAIDAGLFAVSALCFALVVLSGRSERKKVLLRPASTAFRGLLPFQEIDRDRFYGRRSDTLALFERVAHADFRFGVLFGESGSGKTSLIRAGLIPRLWEEGFVPIYCRSYKDPLAALMEECRRRASVEPIEDEPPIEYLERVARELGGPLVIVMDQFEEFFVNFKTKQEREPFVRFIAQCHNCAGLDAKFLVSMRSDFLYLISSEFEDCIRDPLSTARLYHLKAFNEEQAAEIIEKSARKAGLAFEPGLSRIVARDLADDGNVLPSELQIVGERLQSRRIFTAQEYRRAGGKEPLVHSFLEDVIQASGDRETCSLLLRGLISDDGTRLTLTLEEAAKRAQRSREKVERLLNLLVGSRLVRVIQDDELWRYELMHEYLIEKINQITGRVMNATQRANRLLRQYASNYVVDKRTRIPITRLWFIRRYSDIQRAERERELFRKSLRRGLFKTIALVLLLAGAATLAAAVFSVNEEWHEIRLKDGHTAAARKVTFSPDGRLLVSCGEDGKVIVWDFARRETITTLTDHAGWVSALAYSADGKWFATGGNDRKVIVWDAMQLRKVVMFSEHEAPVNGLAFSPDGRWLASVSGSPGGRTVVWDTARWEKVYELSGELSWGEVLFSPDGRRALIASSLWDLASTSLIKGFDPGWTWSAISPDGKRLAAIDPTGTVSFYDSTRFWDKAEEKIISSRRVHSYHGRAVAFSPDGRLAASGADDIILWDAETQAMLLRFNYSAQVWSLAFSPDGKWLVSGHDDGAILVWDVTERKQVASLSEHAASVHAIAFSPDGKRLASAGEDRSVIVWDAERGEKEAVLNGHTNRITAVAFSPDGKWVASTDMDSNLIVWDLTERRPRWAKKHLHLDNYYSASYCLAISPDGRWVANSNVVYDSRDGRRVSDFGYHSEFRKTYMGGIYGLAFSPDGRRAVAVTDSGAIALWETETWQGIEGVKSSKPVTRVSFSPDGKHFVTGDDDGEVRLWEINPIRAVAVIGRHQARIKSIAFSPDGSEVASAGDDQVIALWDVSRRSLITQIGHHASPVLSVAFSPDGKHLASGEHDRSVRIYTRRRTLWGWQLD